MVSETPLTAQQAMFPEWLVLRYRRQLGAWVVIPMHASPDLAALRRR